MRSLVIVLLLPACALCQEKFVMEPGPKSPEESLKCMKARPGFKVELMACEPAVMDPIAFAWGPDGKLWVVEMGDYPLGVDGAGKKGGRVKFLEKSKPDGQYDKATVFLDDLGYPTGVFPWKKGVLITCAPDILYAEDTNNDGKADKVEKLYTGFREGNQQHRVNGLVWGLDNWIYGANGDSGGTVKSMKTGDEVNINGRDFRIRPETGEIEAVTGQSQFGRSRDDWGNWFGNNNSNPMFHYVLEDRYLRRNPTLLFTDVKVNVSEKPGASQVFPISKPLPRFNTPKAVNHFTSACSAIIYRDDLFGPKFEGNSFVSEPVHNLIHREIVRPEGLTFRSKRADDEQDSEFLASSDNWFRPAMIQTGPDGALWIADMYRYVIEHPEWIPKDWQKKLDLRAGHDRGRIYRVYPEDKKPRDIPNLAKLEMKALVAALDSPSGWQRDMAQQLIVTAEKQDDIGKELQRALKSARAQTRLHALMALSSLSSTYSDTFFQSLGDPHPDVRKHAILFFEDYWGKLLARELVKRMEGKLGKEDPTVRLQLAYTLGEFWSIDGARLLNRMAIDAEKDSRLLSAVLSSVNINTFSAFIDLSKLEPGLHFSETLVQYLIRFSISTKKAVPPHLLARSLGEKMTAENVNALASLCDSLEDSKLSMMDALKSIDPKMVGRAERIFEHARSLVDDSKAHLAERLPAVRLLGRGLTKKKEDLARLENLLIPATPDELQQAVLTHLMRIGTDRTPEVLVKKWKHFSPGLRGPAFDTLISRQGWTEFTLIYLEAKTLLASELDASRRQRLLNHPDAETRRRAEKILASFTSKDRAKVIDGYLPSLLLQGDAKKGAPVFMRACASCHRLGEIGQNVGPDLASVGDRTAGGLLNAILDPNRAVEPRYINYLAETKAGVTYTGILAGETSTSLTLVAGDGKKTDILRGEVEELISTGKSAMPEGLEKDISLQEMADLLTYLTTYLPPKLERSPSRSSVHLGPIRALFSERERNWHYPRGIGPR